MMYLNMGYAIIDLETTGLDCWDDLIIEMGVLLVIPGQEPRPQSVLINIGDPLAPEITQLTGITDSLLINQGLVINDALRWFKERTGTLPLVGHNILRFQRGFLLEATRRHRRETPQEERVLDEVEDFPAYRFIDTAALFNGYRLNVFPTPGESHYQYVQRVLETPAPDLRFDLHDACRDLSIDTTDVVAHRASGDVTLAYQLFLKLLDLNPPQ